MTLTGLVIVGAQLVASLEDVVEIVDVQLFFIKKTSLPWHEKQNPDYHSNSSKLMA